MQDISNIDWQQGVMLHRWDGQSTHAPLSDSGPLVDMLRRVHADAETPLIHFTLMAQGEELPPVRDLLAKAMEKGLVP
jgi:hypothetical protein